MRARQIRIAIVAVFVAAAIVGVWVSQQTGSLHAPALQPRAFANPNYKTKNDNHNDDPWIELVAYALSVPSPDDPIDYTDPSSKQLQFRDPTTLEMIAEGNLNELGVPEDWKFTKLAGRYLPRLKMILKPTEHVPKEINVYGQATAWDTRTNAELNYGSSLRESPNGLISIELSLRNWHDTPIEVGTLISGRNDDSQDVSAFVTHSIAGLPDMPNGRDIDDLLDVRIPVLNLRQGPVDNDSVYRRMARIAADAAELEPRGIGNSRSKLGLTRLVDITPRELLEVHAQAHPGVEIMINENDQLVFVYPIPWNERFRNWWDRWSPF